MRSVRLSGSTMLLLFTACGGDPPRVVTKAVASASALPPPAPPPPPRARWVLGDPEAGLKARLDLGDGSTLYVGANGRRGLATGTGPLVAAGTLATEDLVGVLKDERGRFVLVARDGDVFLSKEPLGPIDTTRPGPLPEATGSTQALQSPTTGKAAIMGISPGDDRLLRSADHGTSWQKIDYAGSSKPYGRPTSVALDAQGRGLLVHHPQRLFVTSDDGATWSPIATPRTMGARLAFRDGSGRVHLEGYDGSQERIARLDGGKLAVTEEPIRPLRERPPPPMPPGSDAGVASASPPPPRLAPPRAKPPSHRSMTQALLAGDRIVELTAGGPDSESTLRSARIGESFVAVRTASSSRSRCGSPTYRDPRASGSPGTGATSWRCEASSRSTSIRGPRPRRRRQVPRRASS